MVKSNCSPALRGSEDHPPIFFAFSNRQWGILEAEDCGEVNHKPVSFPSNSVNDFSHFPLALVDVQLLQKPDCTTYSAFNVILGANMAVY